MTSAVCLSVVIPVWNESESIPTLACEIEQALATCGLAWEVIWVDDGSTDDTAKCLQHLSPPQRSIRVSPHGGKSAAYVAGFRAASGDWIATLDGDGQNHPEDILALWHHAAAHHLDVVVGVRTGRRDPLVKRISSRVGNVVRRAVLWDTYADIGCGIRLGRRAAFDTLPTFEGMHRFIPVFMNHRGFRVGQHPVLHRERQAGTSKYGILNRFPRSLVNLVSVWWYLRRHRAASRDAELAASTRSSETIDGQGPDQRGTG
jgi:dolichol-phosphate mannosyltransferase